MKHSNSSVKNHINTSLLVSLLFHLVVLIIFTFINFGHYFIVLPKYSTISFSDVPTIKHISPIQKEIYPSVKENILSKSKIQKQTISADTLVTLLDTAKIHLSVPDSNDQYLEFAETLLDSFLVRNPQYAKMILKEHAKELADKKFARDTLIKRINDELHNYILKNYPEGSEHELNPYTGPGLQVPIDDLINIVKNIFK